MQGRVSANGRVGATAAVYSAAILGERLFQERRMGTLNSQIECAKELTPFVLQNTSQQKFWNWQETHREI